MDISNDAYNIHTDSILEMITNAKYKYKYSFENSLPWQTADLAKTKLLYYIINAKVHGQSRAPQQRQGDSCSGNTYNGISKKSLTEDPALMV